MNKPSDKECKAAWQLIEQCFPALSEQQTGSFKPLGEEFEKALNVVANANLTEFTTKFIFSKIEKSLRQVIAPQFWAYYKGAANSSKSDSFKQFYTSVNYLLVHFEHYAQMAQQIEKTCKNDNKTKVYGMKNTTDSLKLIFRGSLLAQLPVDYEPIIENFYQASLEMEECGSENAEVICAVCLESVVQCNCREFFNETNRKLNYLGLLEPLVGQVLTTLTYSHIESFVKRTCKDNFECSYISHLESWLDSHIIHWLRKIYCCGPPDEQEVNVTSFRQKLISFLYETYTKIRINQLFNIIIEYPDSIHALQDLSKCLPKTDLRPLLISKLQKAMETRLLHPGVSTPDILTAYVASIRSMRVLDPSGLLLETVTQPVHQYLRGREDTVRCVVSSLTEEGPNDLAEELVKGEAVHVDENNLSDEDFDNWENWSPEPADASPGKSIWRSSDIISMLVNVYGSKELFVNEYRTLLADRLLSQFSCDTEKEIRYLELLKLRFGDSQLHYCDVMLKDIADSKRINQHIKQDPAYVENNFFLTGMIVSGQFWPSFKDENLQLHHQIKTQMEMYTKSFETLKGSRTLSWKNHLGVVDLEIELTDRTLNLSVTAVHATILMHFQDKSEWMLEDLSRIIQVPPTLLRRKIGFWQSHGLIEETSSDLFSIVKENECKGPPPSSDILVEDFESESAMASTQDQREEELQTFWSYIIGMLMNLDSLSLERIHQMLKMFAFQGPTIECSLSELRQFLDRKVREHQLVYSGGLYKLPKHDAL